MTTKRKKFYEIALIVCCCVIIALTAYMGITAIQKSMRLKVGLTVTPIASVELYITPDGGAETLLLRNFADGDKEVEIGSGVTLESNTISYSGTYDAFTMRVVNFTNSTPLLLNLTGYGVDIEGEETYQQTLGVANSANCSLTFDLTSSAMMPGTNNATLKMQFVINSAKLEVSSNGCTYTSGATTLSEENSSTYINFTLEEAYQSGYALNYSITGVESNGYTWNSETGYFAITDWSKVTGDICVSANVSKLYTVTLNANGGSLSVDNTITGTAGSQLGELPNPTKTGYTFSGWYTATSGGEAVTSTSLIPENGATYYAQWTAITYQIAYNANGGSGSMANQTHTYGTSLALSPCTFTAPTDKKFAGWATTANGEVVYEDGELILNVTNTSETITLYAVWEDEGYTLVFNANGGTGTMASAVVGYGEDYVMPATTFENGVHECNFWTTEANGNGSKYEVGKTYANLASVGETIVLYAQWTYTATFTITTGSGYGQYAGYVITNDPGLSFVGDCFYPKFYSTSTGGSSTQQVLNQVTPGATPIKTAQAGTGYYYKETYYNTESQTFTTYPEVIPGDYIFIFSDGSNSNYPHTFSYLNSYETAPTLECEEVIKGSDPMDICTLGVKYIMPKLSTQFTVITKQYYYDGPI